jgi:phosphatidate cytidylyltransferase
VLKQRLLTAAILLPLFIWAVLSLSLSQFALLIAVFVLIGSWEWTTLMGIKRFPVRIIFSTMVAIVLGLVWFGQQSVYNLGSYILLASAVWWLFALYFVISYPRRTALWSASWLGFLIGGLILIPTWVALVSLKSHVLHGGILVISLFVLIWAADSGAYFAGRKFGKTKLAPSVSPGKSWEGVAGGLLLVVLVVIILLSQTSMQTTVSMPMWLFVGIALLTVMVSILGDLAESMFKRRVGVKDSGKLLPGHGGVLDRIDSVTAAAPAFVLCMNYSVDFPFLQQGP